MNAPSLARQPFVVVLSLWCPRSPAGDALLDVLNAGERGGSVLSSLLGAETCIRCPQEAFLSPPHCAGC